MNITKALFLISLLTFKASCAHEVLGDFDDFYMISNDPNQAMCDQDAAEFESAINNLVFSDDIKNEDAGSSSQKSEIANTEEDEMELKYLSPLHNVKTEDLPALENYFKSDIPDKIKAAITILDQNQISPQAVELPNCLILFGRPGVGKTDIAHLVARRANREIVYCDAKTFDIENGSAQVAEIFEYAKSIGKPTVIILKNLETFAIGEVLQTLIDALNENADNPNIFVIAITSHLNQIDRNFVNAQLHFEISLPHYPTRLKIFDYYLRKSNVEPTGDRRVNAETLGHLATATKGWNCVQLKELVCKAVANFDANLEPESGTHSYKFQYNYIDFMNRPASSLLWTACSPILILGGGALMSKFDDTRLAKHMYVEYEKELENRK